MSLYYQISDTLGCPKCGEHVPRPTLAYDRNASPEGEIRVGCPVCGYFHLAATQDAPRAIQTEGGRRRRAKAAK